MSHNFHPTAKISPLADLDRSIRGSILSIGEASVVESFVRIKFSGGLGDVIIGENCNINSGTVIYSGHGVRLGKCVLIAANCTLAASNHEYGDSTIPIREQGLKPSKGGIVIDDDVWIASNCLILDGSHIGKGAVIGAGSLVRGVVAPYAVMGGNPLKLLDYRRGHGSPLLNHVSKIVTGGPR